jgi:hypothetical protein
MAKKFRIRIHNTGWNTWKRRGDTALPKARNRGEGRELLQVRDLLS